MNPRSDGTNDGQWSVYLLLCGDGSLYCGISNNPARRFAQHLRQTASRYTRAKNAVEMRVITARLCRSRALAEEYRIKKLRRRDKVLLWENARRNSLSDSPDHTPPVPADRNQTADQP